MNASKYFIPNSGCHTADVGGVGADSGEVVESETDCYQPPVNLPKLVNSKITQFFPVTVQRFRNKITYKVNAIFTTAII